MIWPFFSIKTINIVFSSAILYLYAGFILIVKPPFYDSYPYSFPLLLILVGRITYAIEKNQKVDILLKLSGIIGVIGFAFGIILIIKVLL